MSLSKAGKKTPAGGDNFIALNPEEQRSEPNAGEFVAFADFWQRAKQQADQAAAQAELDQATRQPAKPPTNEAGEDPAGELESDEAAAFTPDEEEPQPDPLELARQQAEEILQEAKAEAARLQKEAREKGQAEGERRGLAEAKKEYAAKIRDLQKVVVEVQAQRGAIIQRYRDDLLALVKALTDRLVQHEASLNPRVITACFQGAMGFVVENSLIKAHLSSENFQQLKEAGLSDPSLFGGKNRVQLIEDPAIAPGGCRLESNFGEVDATLENCREKLYAEVDRAFGAALAAARGEEPSLPAAELEALLPPPLPIEPEETVDSGPTEPEPVASTEAAEIEAEEIMAPVAPVTGHRVQSEASEPVTDSSDTPDSSPDEVS